MLIFDSIVRFIHVSVLPFFSCLISFVITRLVKNFLNALLYANYESLVMKVLN